MIRLETESSPRPDALLHAPLRRIDPGPLASWGFDPGLWTHPGRLTLLVLASHLFADQRERVRFFKSAVADGRASAPELTFRRADGRPVAVSGEALLVDEAGQFVLRASFVPLARAQEHRERSTPSPRGEADVFRALEGAERASVRAVALEHLAIPDVGRSAEAFIRFFDWVVPRTAPLCVVGEAGTSPEILVDAVHTARGGTSLARLDGELDMALSVSAALADPASRGGALCVQRADAAPDIVREGLLTLATEVLSGSRPGVWLYVTAQPDAPLSTRLAEAGADSYIVPALRSRPQDVLLAVSRLLRKPRTGLRAFQTVHPDAARVLEAYPWPGNVAEMREVAEAARLISGGTELRVEDLPHGFLERVRREASGVRISARHRGSPGRPKKALSAEQIRDALEACGGSRAAAARKLGISRTTLWRKMAEHGDALFDPRDRERPGESE